MKIVCLYYSLELPKELIIVYCTMELINKKCILLEFTSNHLKIHVGVWLIKTLFSLHFEKIDTVGWGGGKGGGSWLPWLAFIYLKLYLFRIPEMYNFWVICPSVPQKKLQKELTGHREMPLKHLQCDITFWASKIFHIYYGFKMCNLVYNSATFSPQNNWYF